MKKKYSVFIGRFQPVHLGHVQVFREALEKTDELIIILGSHNEAPNSRNPFTSADRTFMIHAACKDEGLDTSRISIIPVENHAYNLDSWIASVQTAVHSAIWKKFSPDPYEILLIGHKKDHTSFYLDLFPTWGSIGVKNYLGMNATDVRESMFDGKLLNKIHLTPSVDAYVNGWLASGIGRHLQDEYRIIKEYKESWKAVPWPVTFQTVDAVVVQAGHVLMVTRGAAPGKGLLALPGGFVNQDETLEEAMLRELREETKIDVPEKVLRGSIVWNRTFDDPNRSSRGRTITQAYHINLGTGGKLPKVKGSDDAVKAQWVELSKLDGNKIFEDHLAIIRTMVGI